MPVITAIPVDPTDYVFQGESFRAVSLAESTGLATPTAFMPIIAGGYDFDWTVMLDTVAGEQNYLTIVGSYPVASVEVLRGQLNGNLMGTNSCICTPCGNTVFVNPNPTELPLWIQSTASFAVQGTTVDSTGAALPGCRVVVFDVGQLYTGGNPIVGETVSNGSGVYSVPVPYNTDYQVIAYLAGSPDVAGVTIDDVAAKQL